MKILIVSDTHGNNRYLYNVLASVKGLDEMIHLGDIGAALNNNIEEVSKMPCFRVRGNTDGSDVMLPEESIVMVGRHKAFITHGHLYGVNYNYNEICHHARSVGCDTVMFGHTHVPLIEEYNGMQLINPGSISQPRQADGRHTYIIATVDDDGEVSYELKYIN